MEWRIATHCRQTACARAAIVVVAAFFAAAEAARMMLRMVMWGVSDLPCHPPEAVPDPLRRGALTPHIVRTHEARGVFTSGLPLPGNGSHTRVRGSGHDLRNRMAPRDLRLPAHVERRSYPPKDRR